MTTGLVSFGQAELATYDAYVRGASAYRSEAFRHILVGRSRSTWAPKSQAVPGKRPSRTSPWPSAVARSSKRMSPTCLTR